jgi:hypothetical protein
MQINRRDFLAAAAIAAMSGAGSFGDEAARRVTIAIAPWDLLDHGGTIQWAIGELQAALTGRGIAATVVRDIPSHSSEPIICIAQSQVARPSESFSLDRNNPNSLIAEYSDNRGAAYAVLELADRVQFATDPMAAIAASKYEFEIPANKIRSISRYFVSVVEDKAWFNDREHWTNYLTMLVAQRFNRFSLNFGLGYDSAEHVSDGYFVFPYPFLVGVNGYNVRADGIGDDERDANLAMLKFISDQTALRGMDFQLGLWTHAYKWVNSPNATCTISGLNPTNHAAYCRDALAAILAACPNITGVTLRVHGESGVPEGSFTFWQTLFDSIKNCGRKLDLDMHAKGMTQEQIDIALGTGQNVTLSPKWCGEHMGLPYHPASIRAQEMKKGSKDPDAINGQSLRYGYGNLMKEDRNFGVLFRIWPGTQRFLLAGDPKMYAGFGRFASFRGADGVEFCEPLSFKGREGSGLTGGRLAYADSTLNTKYDWQKYLYQYRLWGRLMYNPDCDAEVWRRYLRAEYGNDATAVENSLAAATRVLPLITLAHAPSAANNRYWPEIYTNMPIVQPDKNPVYTDTPDPKVFGTVSPFDPQLFATVNEDDGSYMAKYSPVEVAAWLDDLADQAKKNLDMIKSATPAARRVREDATILAATAQFFAAKFRAGVSWNDFQKNKMPIYAKNAIESYGLARIIWSEMANQAAQIYVADIAYGGPTCRGHWLDRFAAIDSDLKRMKQVANAAGAANAPEPRWTFYTKNSHVGRPVYDVKHTPPANLRRGRALPMAIWIPNPQIDSIRLRYRHVNQAELWESLEMGRTEQVGSGFVAEIPAEYLKSDYPLQYYFEIKHGFGFSLHPMLQPDLSNQPYFVVT